jgi:hypothetical protein
VNQYLGWVETNRGPVSKGHGIIVLIKRYKAGNVVFLQDQVPALVGVLIFWANLFVLLNCTGRAFLTDARACLVWCSLVPRAPSGLWEEPQVWLISRTDSSGAVSVNGQHSIGQLCGQSYRVCLECPVRGTEGCVSSGQDKQNES